MNNPDTTKAIAEFERVTAYFKPKITAKRTPTEAEQIKLKADMDFIDSFAVKDNAEESPIS